jgi:transposase, IS5 family
LGLLNQAREQTEKIIDALSSRRRQQNRPKPRTYRKIARRDYLSVAKQRKVTKKQRKKAIKKQLQYIARNLVSIEKIANEVGLEVLKARDYRLLLIVTEVQRQQAYMYENSYNRIDDRIVSLTQPHVRPIIRGKAGTPVEFGAKLSASCWNGYVFLDRISWNNFNESGDLQAQVESFKSYTGAYPESLHVDKIYRTKVNRAWCKERGIRMSGVKLGRPPKNISKSTKRQAQLDERIRSCIEGKFGEAKRRFSLNCVMAKLASTSETTIAISFLVMNLSKLLRQFFVDFYLLFKIQHFRSICLAKRLVQLMEYRLSWAETYALS